MEFSFYIIQNKNLGTFYMDHAGSDVFWTRNPKEAETFTNEIDATAIANHIDGIVRLVRCVIVAPA